MRGPLLSGAVGSAVTLRRLCEIVRGMAPTVVVRSPWLGLTLAAELSVVAFVPAEARGAARRRRRRKTDGPPSLFALAGTAVPIAGAAAGSLVATDLATIEPTALVGFLLETAELVRPGGLLVGLDRAKDPATEARLAGALLTAGFQGIVQDRPRDGALITRGHPPPAAVRTVLLEALRTQAEAAASAAQPPPPRPEPAPEPPNRSA
jgi:hypothetical protein